MNNTSKILSVRDLIVDFPVFGGILQKEIDQVHAVKKVSFELYKGETLGIVGESGSGKSTLGNAILNVLRLTAPDVKISGKINLNIDDNQIEISNLSRSESKPFRKHIQMIFQDPYSSLNPRMLVKDIIKEPLDINTDLSTIEKNEKVKTAEGIRQKRLLVVLPTRQKENKYKKHQNAKRKQHQQKQNVVLKIF